MKKQPLLGYEPPEEKARNDAIAIAALKLLAQNKLISDTRFDTASFSELYNLVTHQFTVEYSSITTRMARIFYGISSIIQPDNILVAGSYVGNSLVWLALPVLKTARIVGVDIDETANQVAIANLKAIDAENVEIYTLDAHKSGSLFLERKISLLLLDVDSETNGKEIYISILKALQNHLTDDAIILAHDACYPKFAEQMEKYRSYICNKLYITQSITLKIDQFGLEVTKNGKND